MSENIPIVASLQHCVLQRLLPLLPTFLNFVDFVLQLLLLLQFLELYFRLLVFPPALLFFLFLALIPCVDFMFFEFYFLALF
jgi:hypothetical protein